jgi:capsular exopolysaccharide synthesis family protein
LQTLEISHSILSERYKQQQSEVKPGVGETVQLLFARDELTRAQDVLDRVKDRVLIMQTNMRSPGIISDDWLRAKPPALPVEIMPFKKMVMASAGGFCIPFFLLGLWELRQRRVSDIDQLQKQSDLMVIGEVANLPSQTSSRKNSKSLRRGVKLFEESVDSLRTGLVLAGANRDVRVLAITSAISGEGKTSIAAQLAVSLARSTGQPTLLIDGDMRSPDLHNVFDIELGPGLAQFLLGKASLDDAIYATDCESLDLMPAGRLATSPHRLLGGGELTSLLSTARQKYCYVVIDTPPILGASEALVMSKAADASLLCVMRDVSRIDQVGCAWDRLATADAHPVGAVLSNVPSRRYMYSYGQYSYEVV